MSQQEKDRLIARLTEARNKTLAVLKDADLNAVAHPDSQWQVRDVLGHMAAWDYEAAAALQAYLAGGEHRVKDGLEAFNQQAYQKRKHLDNAGMMADFGAAHEAFKSALLEVPPDKMQDRMAYAWGGYGTVAYSIEGMIEHEEEHRGEIERAT
ncbi:MAG: maleylpyruvate isomerase N-terminal domain-containing protein [Anaerolineae bacterium]|nr:maleylpyruvate isomerase N-terminal domain-containing protein [Anaerolineae bacterium]